MKWCVRACMRGVTETNGNELNERPWRCHLGVQENSEQARAIPEAIRRGTAGIDVLAHRGVLAVVVHGCGGRRRRGEVEVQNGQRKKKARRGGSRGCRAWRRCRRRRGRRGRRARVLSRAPWHPGVGGVLCSFPQIDENSEEKGGENRPRGPVWRWWSSPAPWRLLLLPSCCLCFWRGGTG